MILHGYFQSEKYFVRCENMIRQCFEFRRAVAENGGNSLLRNIYDLDETPSENLDQIAVFPNRVAVHIRRGDYKNIQNVLPLQTVDYYRKAIAMLPRDVVLCVFGLVDQESFDFARQIFAGWTKNDPKVHFIDSTQSSESSLFFDMYAMSKCKHHIIANSSFSWWGAWLSEKSKFGRSGGTIIAPKNWFGPSGPPQNDIVPRRWITL
jgi:hypothetical protein